MGYNKSRLGDLLKLILEHTVPGAASLDSHSRIRTLGGAGTKISVESAQGTFAGELPDGAGPTLSILQDGCIALEDFIDEALQEPRLAATVGRKAIDNQLLDYIRKVQGVAPANADWAQVVRKEIIQPLSNDVIRRACFVPIINIEIAEEFDLGQVKIVPRSHVEKFIHMYFDEHQFGGANEAEKTSQRKMAEHIVQHPLGQSPVFGRVEIDVHRTHAFSVAFDIVRREISVLRAFSSLLHHSSLSAYCYLPSESTVGNLMCLSFETDPPHHSFQFPGERYGHLAPFQLDASRIAHLREHCGLATLTEILKKPVDKQNTFETALIKCFDRVGRAVIATRMDDTFLGYAIALERLLIRDGESSTTERLADRLVFWIRKTPESRRHLLRTIKRLYDIRSKIVHAAYLGVTTSECQDMYLIIMDCLVQGAIRSNEFPSHQSFTEHLEHLKFG